MTDLLNLPGLTVEQVVEDDHQYSIKVGRRRGDRQHCPHCGSLDLRPNGSREVRIHDLPMHGKRVGIWFDRQRFLCPDCAKSCSDQPDAFDPARQMTRRLVEWIGQQGLRRPFTAVADDAGLDESTIRSAWSEWTEAKIAALEIPTPTWMGLDEVYLLGSARGVITDVHQRTLVDFLHKRDKGTIARRIAQMPGRDAIELVTMDMWRPYWTVCRALLPKAQIVVDRWHVQRYANDGLETIRKALRADLPKKRRIRLKDDRRLLLKRGADLAGIEPMIVEAWCNEFPDLGAAYAAKERFAEIWSWGNEADARAGIRSWSDGLAPEIRPAFQPLLTALTNWEAEIFAYFRHPITNAFTECMNGLAKIDNRMGRGYSFEALRAKILLKHSKPKVPRPGFIKGSPFKPPAGLGSGKLIEILRDRLGTGGSAPRCADVLEAHDRRSDHGGAAWSPSPNPWAGSRPSGRHAGGDRRRNSE